MRSNWKVYKVTLINANTEYSQIISADPHFVSVKSVGFNNFRLSLKSDQVELGDEYVTVFGGTSWTCPKNMFGTKTIYLSSKVAGAEIEIEEWT